MLVLLASCNPSGLNDKKDDMYRDATDTETAVLKGIVGKVQVHCELCPIP